MRGPTPGTPGTPDPEASGPAGDSTGSASTSSDPTGGASSGSQPLGANASMSDILARMQALGDTSAPGGTTGPGAPAGPADEAGPAAAASATDAPLVRASGPAVSEGPVGWAYPPAQTPPKKARGRLIGGLAAIFAVIVGLGGKLLLGLAVAGVGGQVLTGLFGGPFEKLPQSTRDGFEQRLNAALGPDADKLSETEYASRYNTMLVDGLSRLDDAKLVEEIQVLATMFDRADPATCAEAARSEWSSTDPTFQISDKMWALLSQDELTAHIEAQVEAIEAAAAKAPDQRTVTGDQAGSAIDTIFTSIGQGQATVLDDLAKGTTHTDAEACDAVRAFHDAEIALSPTDLALVARYTASP